MAAEPGASGGQSSDGAFPLSLPPQSHSPPPCCTHTPVQSFAGIPSLLAMTQWGKASYYPISR